MKIRVSQIMKALVAVALIAALTTVGIVEGAGRRKSPCPTRIQIGGYPGRSFHIGDPLPPAPMSVIVPWELREHRRYEGLVFADGGRALVSASEDATLKVWDARTGELKATLTGHGRGINSVAFAPDGKTLATGSRDRTINPWRVE